MVASWFDELERARTNFDTDYSKALEAKELGPKRGTYCARIEAAHPNYLRELYRKAGNNPSITFRATFSELADEMNRLLKEEDNRPELFLTRSTLKAWFHSCGGKVRKNWERPILTPERMAGRVQWCKDRKAELAVAEAAGPDNHHQRYYCFLDEKWFYIRSRWKKMKLLPRGEHEAEGAEQVPMERESSRRHATKVMVLGVIADPVDEHNFDGKVYFTRVARTTQYAKSAFNDKILDDLAANTALHNQWRDFVPPQHNDAASIIEAIGEAFDLDEDVENHLVLRYLDHTENGKRAWKTFERLVAGPINYKLKQRHEYLLRSFSCVFNLPTVQIQPKNNPTTPASTATKAHGSRLSTPNEVRERRGASCRCFM